MLYGAHRTWCAILRIMRDLNGVIAWLKISQFVEYVVVKGL